MSAPQPIMPAPALYPYQRAMMVSLGSHRWGKTHAMQQALRAFGQASHRAAAALSGLRGTIIIHDELFRAERFKVPAYELAEKRDRSHFERGGRYSKPPTGKLAVAKEPGMVQMRDRRGELVWRKLGAGMAHATDQARMREHPSWGAF